jgi:hypothetical protein
MARTAEKINNLNDKKALWKLHVLIIDMWTVNNSKNNQHVEIVACDKEINEMAVVLIVDMWTVNNSKNKQHVEIVVCDKEVNEMVVVLQLCY